MSFVTHEQQSLVWLASPLLGGVRHGFSTRRGGVSPAPWDTLNLGPGRRVRGSGPRRMAGLCRWNRGEDRPGDGPPAGRQTGTHPGCRGALHWEMLL